MKRIFSSACVAFSLLPATTLVNAQSPDPVPQPVVYSTPPKLVTGKLNAGAGGGKGESPVRGNATLTIKAANDNDSLNGTLAFSISDETRKKFAQITGKPLDAIPARIIKNDVVAVFQRGAACPVAHLEIGGSELEIAGLKIIFNRMVLDIIESQEQVPQLLCAWTRQINARRQRRGIVAAINRLISPGQ